jgi:hypothetical protein
MLGMVEMLSVISGKSWRERPAQSDPVDHCAARAAARSARTWGGGGMNAAAA